MQKSTLESIITKYYLNGLTESVKWVVKNKSVFITFSPAEDKALTGHIECTNGFDMDDGEIYIFNTTQLFKLVKILNNTILLKLQTEYEVPIKLLLSDDQYDLEYYLADSHMFSSKTPKINEPQYDVELTLDNEFIKKFIKAKRALGETKRFNIEANTIEKGKAYMLLGEDSSYSNKIKFSIPILPLFEVTPLPFNVNLFTEVLEANSDATGKLEISKEGLMKLTFTEDNINSTYFIVRLE